MCDECAICYETIEKKENLKCNHEFCQDCLKKWYKNTPSCPMCRRVLFKSAWEDEIYDEQLIELHELCVDYIFDNNETDDILYEYIEYEKRWKDLLGFDIFGMESLLFGYENEKIAWEYDDNLQIPNSRKHVSKKKSHVKRERESLYVGDEFSIFLVLTLLNIGT